MRRFCRLDAHAADRIEDGRFGGPRVGAVCLVHSEQR
jgi:hypothetical protein